MAAEAHVGVGQAVEGSSEQCRVEERSTDYMKNRSTDSQNVEGSPNIEQRYNSIVEIKSRKELEAFNDIKLL